MQALEQLTNLSGDSASPASVGGYSQREAVVAVFSDGYEFELSNCMYERPMDLTYRASAVTDLLWLDHSSLMFMLSKFPASGRQLNFRAKRYDKIMSEVFASPVIKFFESSLLVREKILKNSQISSYTEVNTAQVKKTLSVAHSFNTEEELSPPPSVPPSAYLAKEPFGKLMTSDGARTASLAAMVKHGKRQLQNARTNLKVIRTWTLNANGDTVEAEETEETLFARRIFVPQSDWKMKWDTG